MIMPRTSRRTFIRCSIAAGTLLSSRLVCGKSAVTYPAPDRELMARVPGGRVYVRVNGRLEGPNLPIVLIHGGPGSTHASFLNLLALSTDRAVILYDQLDSGLSDHPGDPKNWTVARFTEEVDCVRRAVGVPRWHVMGHSWGGTVALEYGARRPAELAGLVLASPLISTRSWIADANALRADLPADVQAVLKSCDPPSPITSACDKATDIFYAHYLRRHAQPDGVSAYKAVHPALRTNEQIYHAMWGSSEATGTLRNYNGEAKLAKLDGSRTLFIDGQYDEARPTTVGAFAAKVPGAAFAVVPNGGHVFYQDSPEEALGIIRPWLRSQDA